MPQGAIHKIVPSREVKEKALPTAVDGEIDRHPIATPLSPNSFPCSMPMPMKSAACSPALVSKESSLLAYEPTNTLILTEVQSNISRLMKIIRALDVQAPAAVLKVIELQYAAADQMVASLQSALEGLAQSDDEDRRVAPAQQHRRQRRAQEQAHPPETDADRTQNHCR